ncbi:acyl-CoA dehydrogenase [Compostibacter hankyongensis]|uniref:Flavin-dependent monooxygenase n=1 Tax=Compostibacter hankyongensis TaxID=1007089 RepID=A0ABP8G225_9BACT
MQTVPHPSAFLQPSFVKTLRQTAAAAEKSGKLHPRQLELIYAQRWFKLFVPRDYGGLQLTLPEALHTEESLAWADGSVGWTVTLCSGACWFVGFLPPDVAVRLFHDPEVCLAGSGRPSGRAICTGNGYEITGSWDYATGAPHATVFTVNCVLEKDGAVLRNEDGSPLIRSFWFLKDEVTLTENWQTTGMIATASHSFSVERLRVPSARCFRIDGASAFLKDPLYQYPFLQFAEATLVVNSSGMAAHFMELCHDQLTRKRQAPHSNAPRILLAEQLLEKSRNSWQRDRQSFYAAVQDSWDRLVTEGSVPPDALKAVSNTSRQLAATARKLVDELYPHCGLSAATAGTEINRVWRDFHTATQHSLLTYPTE